MSDLLEKLEGAAKSHDACQSEWIKNGCLHQDHAIMAAAFRRAADIAREFMREESDRLAMIRFEVSSSIVMLVGYWRELPKGFAFSEVGRCISTLTRLCKCPDMFKRFAGIKWLNTILDRLKNGNIAGAQEAAKAMARHFPMPEGRKLTGRDETWHG